MRHICGLYKDSWGMIKSVEWAFPDFGNITHNTPFVLQSVMLILIESILGKSSQFCESVWICWNVLTHFLLELRLSSDGVQIH